MIDYLVSMAFAILFSTIKNPETKAKLRSAFLKLFRNIKIVYAGDPDFQ